MKQATKIDPETIKNGVGNWVLFFVGLEEWKMGWGGGPGEAKALRTRVQLSPTDRDSGFWCCGGREHGRAESI